MAVLSLAARDRLSLGPVKAGKKEEFCWWCSLKLNTFERSAFADIVLKISYYCSVVEMAIVLLRGLTRVIGIGK